MHFIRMICFAIDFACIGAMAAVFYQCRVEKLPFPPAGKFGVVVAAASLVLVCIGEFLA